MELKPIDYEKEKTALIALLKKEYKAYYEKNLEEWKDSYVREPYQVRTGYWEGYKNKIQHVIGWDSLYNHKMKTIFERKTENEWDDSTHEIKNFNARIFHGVAWATYEQKTYAAKTITDR